ncbi:unnamed protein product [Phaeothamnion confervicola]
MISTLAARRNGTFLHCIAFALCCSWTLGLRVAPSSIESGKVREVSQFWRRPAFRKSMACLAPCGAALGPNLDSYHSAFGVLEYAHPLVLSLNGNTILTTDWWVPPLFAFAAVAIGGLYLTGDHLLDTPAPWRRPSWPAVCACIALFSSQYYASGLMTVLHVPPVPLAAALAAAAVAGSVAFDCTAVGLTVAAVTALLGPLVEATIINGTHLYRYIDVDGSGGLVLGCAPWIPLVYFLGGPAVGNLARAFYSTFSASMEAA